MHGWSHAVHRINCAVQSLIGTRVSDMLRFVGWISAGTIKAMITATDDPPISHNKRFLMWKKTHLTKLILC